MENKITRNFHMATITTNVIHHTTTSRTVVLEDMVIVEEINDFELKD
jgi:hypothetical protein